MQQNYETIYCHDDNITDAIDMIDIEDMAKHIYFGPQAEIMAQLNRFNSKYHSDLNISKTFRWSPGTFPKVAEIVRDKLGFARKASGMWNYLSREDYFRRHGWERMRNTLRELDNKLYRLRADGARWLEDPSILIERKEIYKNYISEKVEEMVEMCSNLSKISFINVILDRNPTPNLNQHKITLNLMLHPQCIGIYDILDGDEAPEHIQDINLEMDLSIKIEFHPIRHMVANDIKSFDEGPQFAYTTLGRALPYDERGFLKFPYISDWGNNYGSICYGDETTNVNTALNSMNLSAYGMILINWMSRYTTSTGPHNNIRKSYHGEPEWLIDDYRARFGTNSWNNCNYRPSGDEDYCDDNKCALRSQCQMYKDAHPEPITPEEAEQMTLQWATRMGGIRHDNNVTSINMSTDNIHGGEAPAGLPIQGDREQDHITDQDLVDHEARDGVTLGGVIRTRQEERECLRSEEEIEANEAMERINTMITNLNEEE